MNIRLSKRMSWERKKRDNDCKRSRLSAFRLWGKVVNDMSCDDLMDMLLLRKISAVKASPLVPKSK